MSELTLSREEKNALHTMIHNTAGIEPKDIAQVLGVSHKTVLNYANTNMDHAFTNSESHRINDDIYSQSSISVKHGRINSGLMCGTCRTKLKKKNIR